MSRFFDGLDTPSLQKMLVKVGQTLPDTTTERKNMSNAHQERPGKGVMFYEVTKEHEKGPDYKGFLILEMDYKAGEKLKIAAWMRDTSIGKPLLSLSEDNYTKKKKAEFQPDREVRQGYARSNPSRYDDDVPF
jgi:hypothetical protein